MRIKPANAHSLILTAINPIAHGDTATRTGGNETIFMRSSRVVDGLVDELPDVSENAVRHVLFREPLANHLFAHIKPENPTKAAVTTFYNGGNMNDKSFGDENTLAKQVFTMFPSIELLGGAVNNFIFPRSALKLICLPIAKEYKPYLDGLLDDQQLELSKDNFKLSINDFLANETRTTSNHAGEKENLMIYGYEILAAGCQFYLRASLSPFSSDLAKSALGLALEQWDGFFGGMARQGRGLCRIDAANFPSSELYHNYVVDNAEALKNAIESGTLGSNKVLCKD